MSTAYSVPGTHQMDDPILFGLDQSSSYLAHPYMGYTVRSNDGREFQLVHYQSSGVRQSTGQPLSWVDGSTTAWMVVTSDTSDGGTLGEGFAGIATHTEVSSDAIYEWIQTKGYAQGVMVATGVAVNDILYMNDAQILDAVDDNYDSTSEDMYRVVAVATIAGEASGGSFMSDIILW